MTTRPISEVAADLGLATEHLIPYGFDKAKISLDVLNTPRKRKQPPKLVLVTAITPTPAGEGKTTTSIGLAQAMRKMGESVCAALREPSLGPCFGVKGGGTGGGKCLVEPSTAINLHFNGDFHAISAAHNLLAAAIDNHIHHGNELGINVNRTLWPRVVDMNDRALRQIVLGLGTANGRPREAGFDITAASEVMAILCLADGLDDLRARLENILIGFTYKNKAVYARDLGVAGAMLALLNDAIRPNLVQTSDGTPAILHGGPFANIAHGCNSVLATRMAMHHADWTITEAGFGCDLGAEKFFDIKCVGAGLDTACVVVVATVKALKMHGGVPLKELGTSNPEAVAKGLANLEAHLQTVANFGEKAVVAINRFHSDTDDELAVIENRCKELEVPVALCDHFMRGGDGALKLAEAVIAAAESNNTPFTPAYDRANDSVVDKIRKVTQKVYGGDDVQLTALAKRDLGLIKRLGLEHLPICMAKTQNSLSDDPKLRGRPKGFDITVRRIKINTGAGFLVVLTGDIMRMPGLPSKPAFYGVDVVDGKIVGVV